MNYMIGVDLGTTSTKAVLFDEKNQVVSSANNGYKLYRDIPDMAEEDLDEIFEALLESLRQVVQGAKLTTDDKIVVNAVESIVETIHPMRTLTNMMFLFLSLNSNPIIPFSSQQL